MPSLYFVVRWCYSNICAKKMELETEKLTFKTSRWGFSWLFIVPNKKTRNDYIIIAIGITFYWTMYIGNLIYIIKYLRSDLASALLSVFVSCALTTGLNSFIVGTLTKKRLNELLMKFEELYTSSNHSNEFSLEKF